MIAEKFVTRCDVKAPTTQIRIRKTTNQRLKDALKTAANGMPASELAEVILLEALSQIERDKPAPGALPIVETLRRQRGLGSTDALRKIVEDREEMESVVRELSAEVKDLGKKYEDLLRDRDAGKSRPKRATG